MPLTTKEFDKLFCLYGKKYGIKKLILKAVATRESSLNPRAYRYEEAFFPRYLANKPEWKDKDPRIVSASYGLMQLMWTTAHWLGFRGTIEDLYSPVYNIELGAKLLRKEMTGAVILPTWRIWPIEMALARYNGGGRDNPDGQGKLRNKGYVKLVLNEWHRLGNMKTETECSDEDDS